MGDQGREGVIGRGEVLTLIQRSARRRPLLRVAATQELLRASLRITVQQAMPERSVELLCLLGGFLALRELQAEVDGSAAVGRIVAAGAG